MDRRYQMQMLTDKLRAANNRIIQLEKSTQERFEEQKAQDEKNKQKDKKIHELCEQILADDPREQKLGSAYSWADIPVTVLLDKALDSYAKGKQRITQLIRQLIEDSDNDQACIKGLELRIQELSRYSNPKSKQPEPKEDNEQIQSEPFPTQTNASATTSVTTSPNVIIEETADDITEQTKKLLEDSVKKTTDMEPTKTPHSKRRIRSPKSKAVGAKAKKQAKEAVYTDLTEISEKITDVGWDIIKAIGEDGLSRYTQIEQKIFTLDKTCTGAQIRTVTQSLYSAGAIGRAKVTDPKKSFAICWLTEDIGKRLFKNHYKKDAVLSEAEKILKEHSSFEHGYTILFIQEQLLKNKIYQKVNIFNRKNPIKTDHGLSIVPDLEVIDTANVSHYIEVELGTTPQTDFNSKCSKYIETFGIINIVVRNKESADSIKAQVDKWIESKGGMETFKKGKVRLTPARSLFNENNDVDLRQDKNWKYVYTFGSDNVLVQYL